MKKTLCTLALITAVLIAPWQSLSAADADTQAIGVITGHYAPRNFAAGSISRTDLDKILSAAIRAPSASNRQNWHFTVVQNANLAKRIVSNITEGNILIIVSGPGDSKTNGSVILDCGLATQSIYLAAQALGLGSRIYTGPMDTINATLKGELGLPDGYSAAALVRIGRLSPGTDAVSAASSRKSLDSVVSYK
ncbi:nitroreductase family protein [Treponema primitia]|uniref:nitroreductase family protein n=1 Tax=Treponema primitia TaxID=88058 RepID=UPI0002555048|nr:nitroreductase family protein [Treponema primitia]